jgi:error-prone DNA polymerase
VGFRSKWERRLRRQERAGHFYASPICFSDFVARLKKRLGEKALTKRDLFLLAGARAFDSLGIERRAALWEIQGLSLADSQYFSAGDIPVELPKESTWEGISLDYEAQGVSLARHPMDYWRRQLDQERVLSSQGLRFIPHGKRVKVGGIVICRQMPGTASGVLFITLEDEFGFINLVVWKQIQSQFKETLLTQSFLMCEGKTQKSENGKITHIIVEKAEPLLPFSSGVATVITSHDFH